MKQTTRNGFCKALDDYFDEVAVKEFLAGLDRAYTTMKTEDWERFWTATHNLEKALSFYDKLDCKGSCLTGLRK